METSWRSGQTMEDFTSPLLWTGTVSNWHLIFKLAVYPSHVFARESSSFALTWCVGHVRARAHCCELRPCCRKFMLQNQKAAHSLYEVHASQQANIKAFACDLLISFLSMVSELGDQRFFLCTPTRTLENVLYTALSLNFLALRPVIYMRSAGCTWKLLTPPAEKHTRVS